MLIVCCCLVIKIKKIRQSGSGHTRFGNMRLGNMGRDAAIRDAAKWDSAEWDSAKWDLLSGLRQSEVRRNGISPLYLCQLFPYRITEVRLTREDSWESALSVMTLQMPKKILVNAVL
jgi:hypothetical protein